MKFHYRDLWVPQTATPDQIKSAYRKLARECHPDHTANPDAARFLLIGEAYQTLSDEAARRRMTPSFKPICADGGWVLCPACGAHNEVPRIPESKIAMCGRCRTALPVTERNARDPDRGPARAGDRCRCRAGRRSARSDRRLPTQTAAKGVRARIGASSRKGAR